MRVVSLRSSLLEYYGTGLILVNKKLIFPKFSDGYVFFAARLFFLSDTLMEQKKITLEKLAKMVDGEVCGDPETVVENLADFDNAGPSEITFISKKQQVDKIISSKAAACITPQDVQELDIPSIRVKNPILSATIIHNFFVICLRIYFSQIEDCVSSITILVNCTLRCC